MSQKIVVYFNTGSRLQVAEADGSEEDVRSYYIGERFIFGELVNRPSCDTPLEERIKYSQLERAVCVDFIEKSLNERRHLALIAVFKAMNDNDTSNTKTDPWIPGADCKALKAMLQNLV